MFRALSDKNKALISVLVIVPISILMAWFSSGWQLALLIAAVQLAVVFIARHVWMTDKSNFILRGTTLAIVSGVVLLGNVWYLPFVFNALKQRFPDFPLPDYSLSPTLLLFLLIIVTVVFHYTRDKTPIEKPEKRIADLLEGPTIKQKWASICESLSASIRDIDRATNWSHEYYTPLDAEVEMKTSNRTNKVVKDLLEAIRNSDDRLFLLVGDPGAGKSVALRKLCLDILKESVKREYIPIYVNLKEWTDTQKDWSKTPPKPADLRDFIKKNLLRKDPYLADFFEKYFDTLDENGNLFFILDSFDEIPQVLGTTADAKLIEDLTIVCRDFLKGSKQKRSKGILASREYRMPSQAYLEATTKLTVRPFTFEKIEQSLTQSGHISKATVEQLLRERPELVPSMRNPFITSLLKEYLATNKNQFPKNQADLFENYIRTSIQKAQVNRGLAIPFADVMQVTIEMAKRIFSEAGLQAPLSMLRQTIKHEHFDSIVEIMRYTRIARGDAHNSSEFSFAHRRFYEYFVVQDLLNAGKSNLPLKSIPTDSRWRDTLVLYCEVAPFEDAQRIANYCWFDVILPNNDIRNRASKHCLRFLTEAFRGRQECLVDFHEALGEYVLGQIHVDNDPIDIKLAVEALGVLSIENLDEGAVRAIKLNDSWINDTVIRSCRHIDKISQNLIDSLINIFDPDYGKGFLIASIMSHPNIQMNWRELLTSLSLSEVFKDLKYLVRWQKNTTYIMKKIRIYFLFFMFFMSVILISLIVGGLIDRGLMDIQVVENIEFVVLIGIFPPLIILPSCLSLYSFYYFRNTSFEKYQINYLMRLFEIYLSETIKKINYSRLLTIIIFVLTCILYLDQINQILESIERVLTSFSSRQKATAFLILFSPLAYILDLHLEFFNSLKNLKNTIKFYRKLWNNWVKYRKIDYNEINNREKVFVYFNNFHDFYEDSIFSNLFLSSFLTQLQHNIKRVYGEYPEGFLKVGQSKHMTRLIQLEERWREAEEREVEAEQTKRQTAPRVSAAKTAKDFVGAGELAAALEQALVSPNLSGESRNSLIQFQSRLSKLERDKRDSVLESTAYDAKYNTLVRDYLNFLDEDL
jgi:hypothetical protein